MQIKIKKLSESAKIPTKKYESDFCYDVVATSKEEIAPNVFKYGIGLAFEIVGGNENEKVCIDFRARSSIYKTGLCLANGCGTIDESYRNEVCAIFYRVIPNMEIYEVGDRIGQITLSFTKPITFELVETLSETERGLNGFGSTGR